ncbi:MAG: phosphotransferase [Rhizomicrobium sp.]
MRPRKLRPEAESNRRDAMRPQVTTYALTGHSGARVVLHSAGADSFVRKTAARSAASPRLRAQADKQHALWMFGLPFPKVRAQSTDADGIASFDMNYIPGRTVADAVANGGTFDPACVVKAVERLMWVFTTRVGGTLPPQLFETKIGEVERRAAATIADSAVLDHIRDCSRLLTARDWAGIPESPCHGDLTLENVLLTAGKSIAFIDCDDGFASSFWLDFGKLFQDIDGH